MDERMKEILLKQAQLLQEECERLISLMYRGPAVVELSQAIVDIAKCLMTDSTPVNLTGNLVNDRVAEYISKSIDDSQKEHRWK